MRKRIALSAVSIGVLVACGPHDVDLGGGSGGQGAGGNDGVGGSFVTGGVGGTATGGTGGSDTGGTGARAAAGGSGGMAEQYCGDGVVQYPEGCDDPTGLECPLDCRLGSGVGGGAYGGGAGMVGTGGGPAEGVCGDGVIDLGERCDDGNTVDGDGCSADCWSVDGGTGGSYSTGGGPAAGGGAGVGGGSTGGGPAAGGGAGVGGGSTGGGPAAGGSGGDATGGTLCVTELVASADGCADNDVLLGQAYERCQTLRRSLTSVRFSEACDDYASYSIEVECCERLPMSGAAGSAGAG